MERHGSIFFAVQRLILSDAEVYAPGLQPLPGSLFSTLPKSALLKFLIPQSALHQLHLQGFPALENLQVKRSHRAFRICRKSVRIEYTKDFPCYAQPSILQG